MATPVSQQADRSKIEQIVVQFFAKSLHIILESRIPFFCSESSSGGGSLASSAVTIGQKSKDCWFNLSLVGDCPLSMDDLGAVRKIISEPMAIDVLLLDTKAAMPSSPRTTASFKKQVHEVILSSRSKNLLSCSTEGETNCVQGTVVERWVVGFDWHRRVSATSSSGLKGVPRAIGQGSSSLGSGDAFRTAGTDGTFESGAKQGLFGSHSRKGSDPGGTCVPLSQLPKHVVELPAVYKRTVIMLRSLYSRARLLPAYKLFRLASSSSQNGGFSLSYNVSSPPLPLPETDHTCMMQYSFTPVETPYGRLCLSVAYRHTTAFTALEVMPPILSHIITDYVGSPTTEPSKKFLTDSYGLPHNGGAERQVVHMVSLPSSAPFSPSGPGFARCHSWSGTGDMMQAVQRSPAIHAVGVSPSPSPSYPLSILPHPLPSSKNASSDQFLLYHGSPSHQETPLSTPKYAYTKPMYSQPINIEGNCSRSFSSSPSPSPPASSYTKKEGVDKEMIRFGSAPLNIPKPALPPSPKFQAAVLYHPSRRPLQQLPLPPTKNRKPETLIRALSANSGLTAQLLPSGSPLDDKLAAPLSTSAESPLHLTSLPPDTSEQMVYYGKTGYQPFPVSLIRGSGRVSGHAATEEDFSLPFVPDDDEVEQQQCRVGSPMLKGKDSGYSGPKGKAKIIRQMSQDAAVGFLIRTLNKASALRSYTVDTSSDPPMLENEAAKAVSNPTAKSNLFESGMLGWQPASGTLSPYARKTTNDAMQELQAYKEMKKLLLAAKEKES